MFKTPFKAAAMAAVFGASLAATPASAATSISCEDGCAINNIDPTTGAFTNDFTFTLLETRTFFFKLFSQSVNFPVDNINLAFNGAKLTGGAGVNQTFDVAYRERNPVGLSGGRESMGLKTTLQAGTYTISVRGNSGPDATYSLTGAVPEPMTWAMMIMGFGMVGAGLRRRRGQTVRVAHA